MPKVFSSPFVLCTFFFFSALTLSPFAGAYSSAQGSGPNFLCMTSDVNYMEFTTSSATSGRLYATYQPSVTAAWTALPWLAPIVNQQLPCAICTSDTPTFMQPGSYTCPAGYKAVYHGHLFSSLSSNYKTSAVCINSAPVGVGAATGGSRVYPIETNTLKGEKYKPAGQEMTCAQCVKDTDSTNVRKNPQTQKS